MRPLRLAQHHPGAGSARQDALERVRRIIDTLDLDCACRSNLEQALDRLCALDLVRENRQAFRRARQARVTITLLVELLADLEETPLGETDVSVFAEFAQLFESIAAEAACGAAALHGLENS